MALWAMLVPHNVPRLVFGCILKAKSQEWIYQAMAKDLRMFWYMYIWNIAAEPKSVVLPWMHWHTPKIYTSMRHRQPAGKWLVRSSTLSCAQSCVRAVESDRAWALCLLTTCIVFIRKIHSLHSILLISQTTIVVFKINSSYNFFPDYYLTFLKLL